MDVKIEESGWIKALRLKHIDSYFKHLKWLEHHEQNLSKLGVDVDELKKHRLALSGEMVKIYNKLKEAR